MAVYSTIKICNTSGVGVSLDTSVSPALGNDDWGTYTGYIANGPAVIDVLWFHRNRGIASGKSYVFATAFKVDGIAVKLQEKLSGTDLGSTMSQCMTAGENTTGFKRTDETVSISFEGASGARYSLTWALSSGGYKNITYTLVKNS